MTPKAASLMDEMAGCAHDVIALAVAGLSDDEHQQILTLLDRVRANLSDENAAEANQTDG